MPPPSFREIGEHIGVSKAMVAKLKSKGMPLTSLRAAKQWRDRQPLMRAPTNGRRNCKFAVVKLGPGRRLRSRVRPSRTGNTLEDILNDAAYMNMEAFTLVEEARFEGDENRLALHMRVYLASLHMRLKAEKLAREEMERRKVLVNMEEACAVCRRCIDAVAKRLRRLPQEVGPQCNPPDAMLAYNVLQRAVDEILMAGQKALRDLESPRR